MEIAIVEEEETCGEYEGIHIVLKCACELVPIEHVGDVPPPPANASRAMQEFYKGAIQMRKAKPWIKACEVEERKQMEACDLKIIEFQEGLSSHVDINEPRQTRSKRKAPLHDTNGVDDWQWAQEEKRADKFYKELYSKVKKNDCKYPGELVKDVSGWSTYRPTYRELPRTLPHGDTGFGSREYWMEIYTRNKKAWHEAGLFEIRKRMSPFLLEIDIHNRCLLLTAEEVMQNAFSARKFPCSGHSGTSTLNKEVSNGSENKLKSLFQVRLK